MKIDKLSYWAPRVLSIFLVIIIGYFSIDAFFEDRESEGSMKSFSLYIAPLIILLVMTIISWKRERLGGTLFLAAGLVYAFGINQLSGSSLLMVTTPLFLIGILFHLSQFFKKEIREESPK